MSQQNLPVVAVTIKRCGTRRAYNVHYTHTIIKLDFVNKGTPYYRVIKRGKASLTLRERRPFKVARAWVLNAVSKGFGGWLGLRMGSKGI